MNRKANVIITQLPINASKEDAFSCAIDDKGLIDAICKYRKELEKEDVEVFARHLNILATEKGYYFAFYEKDLELMDREREVKPFMGEDGRMKVIILNEKGQPELKDLALLVATEFVPNPNGYNNVGFYDGDVTNCQAENLMWYE